MITKITNGVKITVESKYQEEYSNPLNNEYVFAYRITILNNTEYTIKLLKRKWFIYDSVGQNREVEGDGVVGEQPLIPPLDKYTYVSGCHIASEIGKMKGYYVLEKVIDGQEFNAEIPIFTLIAKLKLN